MSVTYDYDGDGERRLKTIGTTETVYADRMYEVENGSQRELGTVNIYLGDTRVVSKIVPLNSPSTGYEQQNTYYYHSDHIGNSTLITDYQGREYKRLAFTPHGEVWQEDSLDVLDKVDLLFTGKQMDSETGWYDFGKRYLNPTTVMWLSADPALADYIPRAPLTDDDKKANEDLPGMGGVYNPINLAVYHFAGNNPIVLTDPDGKAPMSYKVAENLYIYSPQITTLDGIIKSAYGFIPFVGEAINEGIYNLGGFKTIDTDSAYSRLHGIASLALDTLSQAENIEKYAKIVGTVGEALKTVGKVTGVLSAILTLVDMGVSASKAHTVAEDTLIDILAGPSLTAKTREGVATLYAYAKIRIEQMIKSGDVQYTCDSIGGLEGFSFSQKAGDELPKELEVLRSSINEDPDLY